MNYLKRRQAELNSIAQELLAHIQEGISQRDDSASWSWPHRAQHRIHSIEPIQLTPKTPPKLAVILRLIRNHVEAESFEDDDLEVLRQVLSEPVEEIHRTAEPSQRERYLAMTDSELEEVWLKEKYRFDTQWLVRSMSIAKFAAEQLLIYLNCFRDDPRLLKRNPIALCESCEAVYFKRRSDQRYCSGTCRHDSWRERKKKKDPEYWTKNARNNRAAHKAQKEAKEKARKRR